MEKIYYSPKGYWKGYAAIKKLAKAAKVPEDKARTWLQKQAIWQVYLPPPKYIPRAKFDISIPNEAHQADLLFLPYDRVRGKTYKYALTVVDVASRYKEAEPLATKYSSEIVDAFTRIYKRSPLQWPKLLQTDPGREFMGAVNKVLKVKGVEVRRGTIHRHQGIVERFNRTLAERLFSHQYVKEMTETDKRSTEWVVRLPSVIAALNNEVTRLTGKKPLLAIKAKSVKVESSAPMKEDEIQLPTDASVRYLYEAGELEGGARRRATDPIWSLKIYNIEKIIPGEPTMYYLQNGPSRGFVREELLVVPVNTETP